MRRVINVMCLVIFSCYASPACAYTLEIQENELQDKVSAMMPIELKKMFLIVTLSNPIIDLESESNEVTVYTDIQVEAPSGQKGTGSLKIRGSPFYKPDISSLFLQEVKIVDMKIDKLPETYFPLAKGVVHLMATKMFAKYPVYTLKSASIKHSIAKTFLKSVSVSNNKLMLEF